MSKNITSLLTIFIAAMAFICFSYGSAYAVADAVDDSDTVSEDGGTQTLANIMGNDNGVAIIVTQIGITNPPGTSVPGPVDGTYGSLTCLGDGSCDYTPNAAAQALDDGDTPTDVFYYRLFDADTSPGPTSDVARIIITINGANDAPVVDTVIGNQTDNDSDVINLDVSGNFSDVDDSLTFSDPGASLPTGLSINGAGLISGTIDNSASQSSPFTVTIRASDGTTFVEDTFTWTISNPAPTAALTGAPYNINEGSDLSTLDGSGSTDPDGDGLTYAWDLDNDSSYDDAAGATPMVTWAALAALGLSSDGTAHPIELQVFDADGGSGTASSTLTINNLAPVVTAPADQTADEGTSKTFDLGTFTDAGSNDTHVGWVNWDDGTSTQYLGGVTSPDITASAEDAANTAHAYADDGTYTVEVWVVDNDGANPSVTFTVTVNNLAPTAIDDSGAGFSTDEDTAFTTGNVLTNDTDPAGIADILSVLSADTTSANGALITNNGDGTFTYNPNGQFENLVSGESVTDTFNYVVSDGDGGTDTGTVTIQIDGVDDSGTVSIAATTNGDEAGGPTDGRFTVTQTALNSEPTVLSYTATGTATEGDDFAPLTGSVTIPAGSLSNIIDIDITDDSIVEATENVILTISIVSPNTEITLGTDNATINIIDNDSATVSIAATTDGTEDGTAGVFTVTQTFVSSTPTVLNIATAGSAASGVDYTAPAATVTIAAGDTEATITVPITNDDIVEATETLQATLTKISGDDQVTMSGTDNATINIIDNDSTEISIIANDSEASESVVIDNGEFTVSLDDGKIAPPGGITVTYEVDASSTASSGSDYTALSLSVTIAEGDNSATIAVVVLDDEIVEDQEAVTVNLTGSDNGGAPINGLASSATVTVDDDDNTEISITASDPAASEPANDGEFTVSLDNGKLAPPGGITVTYEVDGSSTAASGSDYTALSGTVTIAENANSATIVVNVLNDEIVEDPETVTVNLTGSDNGGAPINGLATSATVNIADNDTTTIRIEASDADASEPAGSNNGEFDVILDGSKIAPLGGITVTYEVDASSTATSGSDYTALTGTVTIAEGDNSATIVVNVLEDLIVESTETVRVNLLTTDNANTTIHPSIDNATVTIGDNDSATVSIAATTDGNEAGPADGVFTITQTAESSTDTVLNYTAAGTAVDGIDYASLSGSVTIAAGSTSNTITIDVTDDAIIENTETVSLTISIDSSDSDVTVGTGNASINITDNDSGTVSIAATTAGDEAGGPTDGLFTITQTAVSSTDTVLNYAIGGTATNGTDYAALSGSVTIDAGSTSNTITIDVDDDAIVEDTETVSLIISINNSDPEVTLGTDNASINITDNDSATVSIAGTTDGDEAGVDGVFTVTQTAVSSADTVLTYTVAGTAIEGTDYAALSGSVTIDAGSTSNTITIDVTDDAIVEGTETVFLTISIDSSDPEVYLGTDNASINITDNDSATVSIAGTTGGNEAGPVDGVFTVTQTAESTTDTVLTYTVAGTAIEGTDYTALSGSVTIAAGSTSNTITIDVTDDAIVEDTEPVSLTISIDSSDPDITVGTGNASINITDNDSATVSIAGTTDGNETGPVDGLFTVTQTAVSSTDTVLNYTMGGTAVNGTDYAVLSGSVTIEAGSTTNTITINVDDDDIVENTETVSLTILIDSSDADITVGTGNASINITDNDSATVSIAGTTDGEEAGVDGVFTVTQTAVSSTDTVLTYTVAGTATEGTDYTALSGSVTIAAGSTSNTITIDVTDDTIVEDTETVSLTISIDSSDPDVTVGTDNASINITDDDSTTIVIYASDVSAAEQVAPASNPGEFTVSLVDGKTAPPGGITVTYEVDAGSTATSGSDYTALGLTVTIAEGDNLATIAVDVLDDDIVEQTETVRVNLLTEDNDFTTIHPSINNATVAIEDNDSATVSIAGTTDGNEAGPISGLFTITQTEVSSTDTVLNYTIGGTATNGSDYTALSGTVTIEAGSTSNTITIDVMDDAIVEDDETVSLTITIDSSDTDITVDTDNATINILEDADSATVSIAGTTDGNETGPVDGVFTVTQTAVSSSNTVLTYTVAGTATEGSDYATLSGTVTIGAGTTSNTITIDVTDDTLLEDLIETVSLTISIDSSDPDVTLGPDNATINITDNDTATVNIVGAGDGNETGPTYGDFWVDQTSASTTDTVLTYTVTGTATEGTDYTALSGTVTIPAGDMSSPIIIEVIDDALVEETETVSLTISINSSDPDITVGTDNASIDIIDDDSAIVTIAATTAGNEEGPVNGEFTVTQSAESSTDTVLSITISGGTAENVDDYNNVPGSVTIEAGSTSATITVEVVDDAIVEPDETVTLTIGKTSGDNEVTVSVPEATIDLLDNDTAELIVEVITNGNEEGPVDGLLTVTQTAVSSTETRFTYTMGGSATEGDDYTVEYYELTIAAGQTTLAIPSRINIDVLNDLLDEGESETVVCNLTRTSGDVDITVGTPEPLYILDNDFTITFDSSAGGTINIPNLPDPPLESPQVRETGESITFSISSEHCYYADYLIDNTTEVDLQGPPNPYENISINFTLSNIVQNHDIQVVFDMPTYTITSAADIGGTIDPQGIETVMCGTNNTYIMTPDEAEDFFLVEQIIVDKGEAGEIVIGETLGTATYTFEDVITDHTIEASFDDHSSSCGDPPGTATPIPVYAPISNETKRGKIAPAGDYDYFKLDVPVEGILEIYTTGNTDTYGELYDSNCTIITEGIEVTQDIYAAGNNHNFRIDVPTVAAGIYYLKVRHNFPAMTGGYMVNVNFEADDHGSSCETATEFPDLPLVDATMSGEITAEGDMDYFEVILESEGILTAWTTGGTDTKGILLDSDCQEIDQADSGGDDNNFMIQQTLDAGTYYVAVRHSSAGTGAYTLHITREYTYEIYAYAEYGGFISPYGAIPVVSGGSQAFIITASGANKIKEVIVDEGTADEQVVVDIDDDLATYTHTFTNVTKDHSISVTFNLPSDACVDMSDIPLDARFQAAPANIMFILDDSGSMDWEFLTTEGNGTFSNRYYVFNAGDNVYSGVLGDTDKMRWKSQWSGYNRIYYDPGQTYRPWPTLGSADRDNPRSHPTHTQTYNLNSQFRNFSTGSTGVTTVIVDNQDAGFTMTPPASMFTIDDEDPGYTSTAPSVWHNGGGGWWEYGWQQNTGNGYNLDYYYTDLAGDYTATWTPPAGTYKVYARWVHYNSRSGSVPYTVNHQGGSDTFNMDQSDESLENKLNALGNEAYTFDGTNDNVTLTFSRNNNGSPTASADAVVFEGAAGWNWATSDFAYNNHFYYTEKDDIEYTATWTPTIPTPGTYRVSAIWDASSDYYFRSTSVPYTINHANGSDTVTVDQRQNSGVWTVLGEFDFNTGTSGNVSITYTVPDLDHTVCADAIRFELIGGAPANVSIKNSHYYVQSGNGNFYLVNLVGSGESGYIDYYRVNDINNNNRIDTGTPGNLELIQVNVGGVPYEDIPDDIIPKNLDGSERLYAEEKQNFANWFSFYRRRELTATAAISNVVTSLQGVNIGIASINDKLKQPVLSTDDINDFLDSLYSLVISQQSTPLRTGLKKVGQYFHQYDGQNGGIGSCPYVSEEEGGECQQAFAILMTDGYYNGSNPYVNNADGNNGPPYADSYWNTLADVAMYYYETDLSTTLDNLLPTSDADDANWQHMVTYSVSFGVFGSLNPDDYDDDLKDSDENYVVWPEPNNDARKIDDMWHASVNGRGRFLSAASPVELVDSLRQILQSIEGRIGSASSVSINGDELYEQLGSDTMMFQASYNSSGWTGDVKAYKLDAETGDIDMEGYEWSAAQKLDSTSWNNRLIVTYYDDGTTREGIPFREGDLSDGQKDNLDNAWDESASGITDTINYLRGDSTNEKKNNGVFRSRSQKLGDIVDSSPLYNNGVVYTGGNDGMLHAFAATDSGTISGGQELFAYIPNLVFENLVNLADPTYGLDTHMFFVDMTPSVADLFRGDLETMLVGTLGKGGKGIYALDISGLSNSTFSTEITSEDELAERVMWEYPNSVTPAAELDDMGYTYSRPALVMTNAPDPDDAQKGRWVVIIGNGYNSSNGRAELIILDAVTGELLKKIDTGVGDCNGLSSPAAVDVPTGGYDFRVDYVYAGDLHGNLWKFDLTDSDYNKWGVAYGVDGNSDDSINAAVLADGDVPKPLFTAKGPGRQQIMTAPEVMLHPSSDIGYMVLFGTGKYLGDSDLQDTRVQTVYGIWDYGDDDDDDEYIGSFNRGSTPQLSNMGDSVKLVKQSVYACDEDFEGTDNVWCEGDYWYIKDVNDHIQKIRILSDNEVNYKTSGLSGTSACGDFDGAPCDISNDVNGNPDPVRDIGWYFDLPESGERVVSEVILREGRLILIGYTPKQTPCGSGGTSVIMELDATTGGRTKLAVLDINGDGRIDDLDLVDGLPPTGIEFPGRLMPPAIVRTDDKKERKLSSDSTGHVQIITEPSISIGVTYWLEYE